MGPLAGNPNRNVGHGAIGSRGRECRTVSTGKPPPRLVGAASHAVRGGA